jgi:outer membrane protein W
MMNMRHTQLLLRSVTALGVLMMAFSVPVVADAKPTKTQIERAKKINKVKIRARRKGKTRSGAYVTGGVGLIGSGSSPDNVNLSDGTGLSVGVGYRFMPQLAIEGGLLLGQYDVVDASNDEGKGESSLLGATLSLKYFIPIDAPRVEGYGQIGLGKLEVENLGDTNIDGTMVDFGGGVDYRLSKEVAVGARVGYMYFLGEDGTSANANDTFSSLNGMITVSFQLQ